MSDCRIHRVKIVRVRLKPGWKPHITDHALLRYIERVLGIDLEMLRDQLRSETLRMAIVYGAPNVRRSDCTLVINNGKVVTVLGKKMRV